MAEISSGTFIRFRYRWMMGDSYSQLASDFEISKSRVKYWVWKLNLPRRLVGRHDRWFNARHTERQVKLRGDK